MLARCYLLHLVSKLACFLHVKNLVFQINHSSDIRVQDYPGEIRRAGLFSRELLFSLKSPTLVKAGDQVLFFRQLNIEVCT